jgi:hypothetical protein
MFCAHGLVFGDLEASGLVFMYCAPGHVFVGTEGVVSHFHVLRAHTPFRQKRVPGAVFMFCSPEVVYRGTEGVGSCFDVLRSQTRFRWYRGHQILLSRFSHPDSFSAVPRATGPVFIFHAGRRILFSCFALPDMFSAVPRAFSSVFMFCAPGLVFVVSEGVGSRFQVLRSRAPFRRYQGCPVPFPCFALPDSFSALPRTSGLVFMFCAPGYVFGGTEGVVSRFHVLRFWTHFRRYRGRRVPFSCFVRPESFSAVPRATGPVIMFCASGIVFGDMEGVGSRFHVLRSRTPFRRYRGRPVPFTCFALPDMFSAVPRASSPVFMFCAPELIFGGTEGVGSRFHVLLSRTHFLRHRGRPVPFSCFALPDMFSTVPSASGPVFMFCAAELIFGGPEGDRSCFHVLHVRTCFHRYGGRRVPFSCFAHQTRFRRKRGCRVSFSCFALPESFPEVPRASGPILKFCAH